MVILNFLYILFCLPVITAGAATSALYYATVRMADGTFNQPLKDFWNGFKDNFRAVTPIWVVALIYGVFLGYLILMNRLGAWGGEPVTWIYIVLGAIAALLILIRSDMPYWIVLLLCGFSLPAYLKGRYFSRNFNKLISVLAPDSLPPKIEEEDEE